MTFLVKITFMISEINIVTSKNLIFDIKNDHCYYNSIDDINNRNFNWILDIKNKGFY